MNNKKTTYCLIFYIFFFNYISFGQSKMYCKDTLLAEIDFLFSSIDEIHPDMYSFFPKSKFNIKLDSIKSNIKSEMTIFEFYKSITPLVINLGDGHTYIKFPFDELKQTQSLFFPFPVDVNTNDSTVTIAKDYTEFGNIIPIGSKILSINNIPIKELVFKMTKYCSGEKYFFKLSQLNYLFTPLLYTIFSFDEFLIASNFNGENKIFTVKGIPYSKRYDNPSTKINTEKTKNYTFKLLPDKNIGIIDFKNFLDLNKFKVFLDSVFTVIKKEQIKNLIIDTKNNGGGNSQLGDELFQYISPCPFSQYGKMIIKYSDKQKKFYNTFFGLKVKEKNGINIYHDKENKLIKLKRNKLRYNGNIYLLISHSTFSSAASFSWAFKYFKMGIVIGEESGGMAVHYGNGVDQTLPFTKLNFTVSHKKFYQYGTSDEDNHGTIPDYEVKNEKALDFTIDLIQKSTK